MDKVRDIKLNKFSPQNGGIIPPSLQLVLFLISFQQCDAMSLFRRLFKGHKIIRPILQLETILKTKDSFIHTKLLLSPNIMRFVL